MQNGVFFSVASLIYCIITIVLYMTKEKIKSYENNIFTFLIFFTLFGLFLEITISLRLAFGAFSFISDFMVLILNKLLIAYMIIWLVTLTYYVFYITIQHESSRKKLFIYCIIFSIISFIVSFVLPIEIHYENGLAYSSGLVTRVAYGTCLVLDIACSIAIIIGVSKHKIKIQKYYPILTFSLFGFIFMLVQYYYPELTLVLTSHTVVIFVMYHTIENPDIKLLQQVELEKDRADKANQAKSDFLSSMSHEIRTPLNAIVGFSECIVQSDTLEEAKDNAKDIIGASQTLLEIVNGILDISKIESGKIELIETDYDPYKMLEETVKLAKGRLAEKPLDFQVNIAQDIPKVLYGDKFNIKKILINFLTNAIKYTDEGFVRFDVQCVKMNGMVRLIFIVSDSGRGIKKEEIGKLFTKFQRLDEEKNQTIEGTGLGLAITKQLIEMMKGSVVVDSVYGEGSKFTFVLDQKISEATLDDTTAQLNVVVDLSGKKILVVDDNKLNLKVADKLLKQYNVSTTLCNSGHDCLELIGDGNKYDIILLDDMMPQMSGTETLNRLKKISGFNIPVVALTANAINGMKEKYLEAGFDDYLAKPIDRNELYKTLVKFLNPSASYDKETNSMVISTNDSKNEDKEEPKQDEKIQQDPAVPRITKDIPKFVPDNVEIVVKPGNKELEEQQVEQTTQKDNIEEEKNNEASEKVKILIVDDNNLNIKVESKLITSLGYEVQAANSGIEAIKMVQHTNYDLIFMDIMMPMMDGVKTFHELKKLDGFDVPTIALTADAVLGAEDKYLAEGFNLYVTKPATKEDFDKIIKKYIQ